MSMPIREAELGSAFEELRIIWDKSTFKQRQALVLFSGASLSIPILEWEDLPDDDKTALFDSFMEAKKWKEIIE